METLKIKSIKKTNKIHHVYDLSVENNNNFYIGSNGDILTHNCDFLTIQAQASLRNIIETFSRSTRFIMTCNYIDRIIEPLQSRCQVIKITPPHKKIVAEHVSKILDKENIKWDIKSLASVINNFYPDVRKILNILQLSSKSGQLDLDPQLLVADSFIEKILKELEESRNLNVIRQIIADSNTTDFEKLYKELFNNVSRYAPKHVGSVLIIIEEYLYHSNFRIDKEINICACLAKIIQTINK